MDKFNLKNIRKSGELYSLSDIIKAMPKNKQQLIRKKKGDFYINEESAKEILRQLGYQKVGDTRHDNVEYLIQLEQIELEKIKLKLEIENLKLYQIKEENDIKVKQMELDYQIKQLDHQVEMNKMEIQMAEMGIVEVEVNDQPENVGAMLMNQIAIELQGMSLMAADVPEEESDDEEQPKEEWMIGYGEDDDDDLNI